ncbi:MAG: hypothetical protein DRJ05_14710 [Bacteroidetes bacterium]|nr:MAG: hypothetical protein DRJ05_14710 [Bacteroidota bacterium]
MKNNITTLLAVESFINEHEREIRGHTILPDSDIANLYEISIEEIHKTLKKNPRRFPPDFAFLLNDDEKEKLFLTGNKIFAFTQPGILMLGGQLKSKRAIRTQIQLIELFVDSMPGKVFEILSEMQNQNE